MKHNLSYSTLFQSVPISPAHSKGLKRQVPSRHRHMQRDLLLDMSHVTRH